MRVTKKTEGNKLKTDILYPTYRPSLPPIVLIGYQNVGKSSVASRLSEHLACPYIDLDISIEQSYYQQYQQPYRCRQIMLTHGENFFRQLEHTVLRQLMRAQPAIIALGGGTPCYQANQVLLRCALVIHLTAPQKIIFTRLQQSGRPAYFNPQHSTWQAFYEQWQSRYPIYTALQDFSVDNQLPLDDTINAIITRLNRLHPSDTRR